jgi:hypothetical protein
VLANRPGTPENRALTSTIGVSGTRLSHTADELGVVQATGTRLPQRGMWETTMIRGSVISSMAYRRPSRP